MFGSIMKSMGKTNAHWGVCGFTSTFYSMYDSNPGKRAMLINASLAFRVLAEIKTYLMMAKADGRVDLLNAIEAFTQSFGVVDKTDFSGFTIDAYIQHINTATGKNDKAIMADAYYSIAMPPEAVADYLKRIWDRESDIITVPGGEGPIADGIVGVKDHTNMPLYDGLCHYMYRKGNKIHSWGKVFNSVKAANKNFQVCRFIKLRGA